MTKEQFMEELRKYLADLPDAEYEQAIQYYEDYFADAGKENEQQVIRELRSPEEIAKEIKNADSDHIEYGQDSSYKQTNPPETVTSSNEKTQSQENQKNAYYSNWTEADTNNVNKTATDTRKWNEDPLKVFLVIALIIGAVTVGLPVISTMAGVLIAIFAVIFTLIIATFCLGIGLSIGGIVSCFLSFGSGSFASGILIIGIGLLLFGLGLLFFWLGIKCCSSLIPAIIQGITSLWKEIVKLFQRFFGTNAV